ncbi:MAG: T9SS type A sorting domain-containing protein, partial [Bacteroidia bacterium]|nr:T9SS type A sorting domain-containing protein [Bacteroidia bacterium]
TTRTGGSLMLTDGLMQPAEIVTSQTQSLNLSSQLKLYPNPASEWLELEIWDFQGTIHFEMFDITGRNTEIQSEWEIQPGLIRKQIPVSTLSTGVYAVKILAKNGHSLQSFSQKITIIH